MTLPNRLIDLGHCKLRDGVEKFINLLSAAKLVIFTVFWHNNTNFQCAIKKILNK
jgi:hypothetical protein